MPALSPAAQTQLAGFATGPIGYLSSHGATMYEVRTPVSEFTPVRGGDAAAVAAAVRAAQASQFGQTYAAFNADGHRFIAPASCTMTPGYGHGMTTPLVLGADAPSLTQAVKGVLGLGTTAGPVMADHSASDLL